MSRLLLLQGSGANGKSTLLDTLKKLLRIDLIEMYVSKAEHIKVPSFTHIQTKVSSVFHS